MINRNWALRDYPSDFDFRGTFWGMSKDEVKNSELSKYESESVSHLSYKDRIIELDAVVGYHFIDNSLVEAGYAFRDIYDEEGLYLLQYGKLKDHISEKYGNPLLDEDINTFCSNDGEEEDHMESMMLLTEWLTERSIIRMILMGDTESCEFGVLHRSSGHLHVIEQTEKSVRWGIS